MRKFIYRKSPHENIHTRDVLHTILSLEMDNSNMTQTSFYCPFQFEQSYNNIYNRRPPWVWYIHIPLRRKTIGSTGVGNQQIAESFE